MGKVIGQARQLVLVCPAVPFTGLDHVPGIGECQLAAVDQTSDVVRVPVGDDNYVDVGRRESCPGEALEHPARRHVPCCCGCLSESGVNKQSLRWGGNQKAVIREPKFPSLVQPPFEAGLELFRRSIGVYEVGLVRHLAVADDVAGKVADPESELRIDHPATNHRTIISLI